MRFHMRDVEGSGNFFDWPALVILIIFDFPAFRGLGSNRGDVRGLGTFWDLRIFLDFPRFSPATRLFTAFHLCFTDLGPDSPISNRIFSQNFCSRCFPSFLLLQTSSSWSVCARLRRSGGISRLIYSALRLDELVRAIDECGVGL